MTCSTGQRRHHFKNIIPEDPAITPFGQWPEVNQIFLKEFRARLQASGYGFSALNCYTVGARLAIGHLNKPHGKINLETDLERVRQYIFQGAFNSSTKQEYFKGLHKLAEYLREDRGKPAVRRVNWTYHLDGLLQELCEHVRNFIAYRQKNWRIEDRFKRTLELLSQTCTTLRWMNSIAPLQNISKVTPQLWFAYLDAQMAEGYSCSSINCRLSHMQAFLRFLEESGTAICQRMLLV